MAENREESESVELVKRISAGDLCAEEELVVRYRSGIFVIINRIVQNRTIADDLLQNTFMIVLKKLREGDIREPEKLPGFVAGIARNHTLEYIRKARSLANSEDPGGFDSIVDAGLDPYQKLLNKELRECALKLINELPRERDRTILIRFYINGESKEQICDALQLESEPFDKIIYRAKTRFKELFKRLSDRPGKDKK